MSINPVTPNKKLNVVLAFFLGIMVSLVIPRVIENTKQKGAKLIDIHSHILTGSDDGAKGMEGSIKMPK